jgi:hypothetical protein
MQRKLTLAQAIRDKGTVSSTERVSVKGRTTIGCAHYARQFRRFFRLKALSRESPPRSRHALLNG